MKKVNSKFIRDIEKPRFFNANRSGFAYAEYRRKIAFTLAEVLITLGIIGIVAAMTLPSLITSYRKQESGARLKKFNSTMAQVLILSQEDNGQINEWDMSLRPEDFLKKYFAPYMKYLKINTAENGWGQFYFTDGSTVRIGKGRCMDIHFDVNGDRKPNKVGYDTFAFLACDKTITEWCSKKGWCTYYKPAFDQSREARKIQCKSEARYCSALLEYDNWEFKEDYPYKL